jgi:prolipoprotein diacylglyceryl transferase
MTANYFMLILTILAALYLFWGFRVLPRERWQILAAVPVRKEGSGNWAGTNLTWYGLLTANAYLVAVAVLFILLGAIRVPLAATAAAAVAMLLFCVPASSLVARIVEKKAHTFTVGGAVFVGVLLAPWVVTFVNFTLGPALSFTTPPVAALAAFSIAYAFGEGFGRLACISFGCCYGKPLAGSSPLTRRVFADLSFVFFGKTRKIAYAGNMEGEKVLPIQALTAIIYVGTALCATSLFLHARYAAAYILSLAVTQGWRVFSETMRADYRGTGTFSAYQAMGLLSIIYGIFVIALLPSGSAPVPTIAAGLVVLWHPAPLLFLQILWLAIFLHTGKSSVTGSTISFHVHQDRI